MVPDQRDPEQADTDAQRHIDGIVAEPDVMLACLRRNTQPLTRVEFYPSSINPGIPTRPGVLTHNEHSSILRPAFDIDVSPE